MGIKIDLLNQRFGRLVVVEESGRNRHKNVLWRCLCDCGGETITTANTLRMGKSKSCGCLQKEKARENTFKDLTGKRFGKLLVIKEGHHKRYKNGKNKLTWLCECDCGNKKEIPTSHLTCSNVTSCGCNQSEMMRDKMTGENHYNFNPSLTDAERMKHRYVLGGKNADKWRKSVFERDNYTCQLCQSKNGEGKRVVLNAHHLDGWNWCEDKRFDVSNGITLCVKCHDRFHSIYGSGDNTKEQFEVFVSGGVVVGK